MLIQAHENIIIAGSNPARKKHPIQGVVAILRCASSVLSIRAGDRGFSPLEPWLSTLREKQNVVNIFLFCKNDSDCSASCKFGNAASQNLLIQFPPPPPLQTIFKANFTDHIFTVVDHWGTRL